MVSGTWKASGTWKVSGTWIWTGTWRASESPFYGETASATGSFYEEVSETDAVVAVKETFHRGGLRIHLGRLLHRVGVGMHPVASCPQDAFCLPEQRPR